uniref:Uncharacterized protein n=1 Tax=Ditylenchus dipsaci TaxID=166011 RepID=A0A915DL96_9BILA
MIVIPGLIVVVVPILVISFFLMQFYNRCSVQFRRLTSKSLSTLCLFVQDAYLGADSIRTYNVVQNFGERACKIADYASEIHGFLGEIARNWREVEVQVVGIERVQEYINNEPEAEWRKPAKPLSERWPTKGRILFENFCFRYRPDSDLENFSNPGTLRIVEPASGTIRIDDVDIGSIGLHDLRQALTIIPQDPVLFCGTLRSNLDPSMSIVMT